MLKANYRNIFTPACVMDRNGKKLVHTNIKDNDFEFFLKLIAPYRHDLTICAECMFGWYWPAFIRINWPRTALLPSSNPDGTAILGRNGCSRPNPIPCADWLSRTMSP